jgi:hypothetical protein
MRVLALDGDHTAVDNEDAAVNARLMSPGGGDEPELARQSECELSAL